MTESDFNPYAAPQTNTLEDARKKPTANRSGWLLGVTIIHVTIETFIFLAVSCLAVSIVVYLVKSGLSEFDVLMIGVMGLVPLIYLLLVAEFRNFRPAGYREQKVVLAVSSVSVLPLGLGCYNVYKFVRTGDPATLNASFLPITIGVVWIASACLRYWLWHAQRGKQ